jgi:transposase
MTQALFDMGESNVPSPHEVAEQATGTPRLRVPHRDQIEMQWCSLDELLELDHTARVVWATVGRLDLSRWLGEIKSVEGHVGRDATDPRLLVALWVFATLQGVGSAREVARLCRHHIAYKWLCGGVMVNYHLLSDFRSEGGDKWDDLLTQLVATLLAQGLVSMQRVAQDGMRVRANAGKSSFRRRCRLEEYLAEAREQVETLKRLGDETPEELTQRQRAARERAAAERERRIQEATRQCEQLQQEREASAKKSGRKAGEARASTTDPDAQVMQFSDGGFRPGMNVQFSTDTASGVIVGVDVTKAGNDQGQLAPMLQQIEDRYGQQPKETLVDGGFASLGDIEAAESEHGCAVYAPVKNEQKQLKRGKDPYAPKKTDGPGVASWRARMSTPAARVLYRLRCQTAEWVNAQCRNRALWQMPLRGLKKCRVVAVLYALAHNLMQGVRLRAKLAMASG